MLDFILFEKEEANSFHWFPVTLHLLRSFTFSVRASCILIVGGTHCRLLGCSSTFPLKSICVGMLCLRIAWGCPWVATPWHTHFSWYCESAPKQLCLRCRWRRSICYGCSGPLECDSLDGNECIRRRSHPMSPCCFPPPLEHASLRWQAPVSPLIASDLSVNLLCKRSLATSSLFSMSRSIALISLLLTSLKWRWSRLCE